MNTGRWYCGGVSLPEEVGTFNREWPGPGSSDWLITIIPQQYKSILCSWNCRWMFCLARRKAEFRGEELGCRGSGELVLVGDCWRHWAITQTPARDLTWSNLFLHHVWCIEKSRYDYEHSDQWRRDGDHSLHNWAALAGKCDLNDFTSPPDCCSATTSNKELWHRYLWWLFLLLGKLLCLSELDFKDGLRKITAEQQYTHV